VTWEEDWSERHRATAAALLEAFRADAARIAGRVGELAATELVTAHERWVDWLGRGRVRKLALVAEAR
jgi:hypothetical protein